MNLIASYLCGLAKILWTFRGRPACRIAAIHGLWLDYRGEVLSRLSSR